MRENRLKASKDTHLRWGLIAVTACSALVVFTLSAPAAGEKILKVLDASTGRTKATFTVELAQTLQEQIRGLQGRDSLEASRGMLFTYPDSASRSFWMKEVAIPLDFLFADTKGRITEIMENRPPCLGPVLRCPPYRSQAPAHYVLEILAGQAKAHGIKVGDRFEFAP
jgi:uncharacterized membrane protein (UPF0127 family)